jgi:hypothetical protein
MKVTIVDLALTPVHVKLPKGNTLSICLAPHATESAVLRLDSNYLDRTLENVVDCSERLDKPRVILVEGMLSGDVLILGGPMAYKVNKNGVELAFHLFRQHGDEEYWTTQIVETESRFVLILEREVIVIDENLAVTFHEKKLYNDEFVNFENDSLVFLRDGGATWQMSLRAPQRE